eukprot:CAMPEP_0175048238 /NCGR_PEP_ID=MMETSP0052_2-20121109/6075_1 /TAXON_ID=51329 ORGANISM="Polytomella parva, Strain SAG 63-3" /NCGR_SAMPLE_ID=MMETSP0052_2 /ASSEMBLY_ACC=CAM_ASM_000194 /LENGTH=91 /DNA_ID=CAMNT_0016312273 /DNA_START=85 /DNA_END=360 /DNA_ORIENTATION=+
MSLMSIVFVRRDGIADIGRGLPLGRVVRASPFPYVVFSTADRYEGIISVDSYTTSFVAAEDRAAGVTGRAGGGGGGGTPFGYGESLLTGSL